MGEDNKNSSWEDERVTLEIATRDFLEIQRLNSASPSTIRNYRFRVTDFVKWLSDTYGLSYVDELRVKHLRGYVAYLKERPSRRGYSLADTTVYQYTLEMLIFCHWLEHEELIPKSIIVHFDLPRYEMREITALTHDDFQKLLAACEEGHKNRPRMAKALASRNRAIVSLLFDAGIRRSELAGLCLGDIDSEMRLLHIRRKGGEWQQVPVSYEGFKPLHEYITRHRSYFASLGMGIGSKRDDPVFLNARGGGFL